METTDDNQLNDGTEQQSGIEDAFIAVEVLKSVLEKRPRIREGILGEKFINLSREEKLQEMVIPRLTFFFADLERKIPALFFRLVGDGGPIVEATFYPFDAIAVFLEEARRFVGLFNPPISDPQAKDEAVFHHAVELTLILIDNLYRRIELTSDHLPIEVIGQWRRNKREELVHYRSERGDQTPLYKDILLDLSVNGYRKEILGHWKYQGQTHDNWRKVWLAEEYEVIYKHWSWLVKMSADDKIDWRDYAKPGRFQDTPDDLLNKVMDVDRSSDETTTAKVSELAIEHAARRVGLIKKRGVSEYARSKRKEGSKFSDYSSQQLFTFLKEGRELEETIKQNKKALSQIETEPCFEEINRAALEKKRKLLEQKIQFIQERTEIQLEQKAKSG